MSDLINCGEREVKYMTSFLEYLLKNVLYGLISSATKNLEKQSKIQEEEKRRKELRDGSIEVEFEVKKDD